jgi:hypothetical protein
LNCLRKLCLRGGHAVAAVLAALLPAVAVQAATCFAIDDDSTRIIVFNSNAPPTIRYNAAIGSFPIDRFEATYFDSALNRYMVVAQDSPNRLGYVEPLTGAFVGVGTALGTATVPTTLPVGSNNDTGGNRITGLTANPLTNRWYVINNNGVLFEINPFTGALVTGAFGGADYLQVRNALGTATPADDVEDLVFDASGRLFVLLNNGTLYRDVSLITGRAVGTVATGQVEAEGLALTGTEVRLIVGRGFGGTTANRRNVYRVDTTTGALDLVMKLPNAAGSEADYESIGCNNGPPRADLSITLSAFPTAVVPGSTFTYSLSLSSQGIDPAYRVQVGLAMDAAASVVSSSIGGGCVGCSFDPATGIWTIGEIDLGQRRTLTLVVSTAGVAPDTALTGRAQIVQACDAALGGCVPLADTDSVPGNKSGAWNPTEDDEAVATVLVSAVPVVNKAFLPPNGLAGQTATLVLTLSNAGTSSAVLTSALADIYPAGLVNGPIPAAAKSCSGGIVSATPGGTGLTLSSGVTIPAGGSCTATVVVAAYAVGTYVNSIPAGALTVTMGGLTLRSLTGATAQYRVDPANLGVHKSFTPDGIAPGGTSTLRISFSNPTAVTATFTTAFIDAYPAGLVNAAVPAAATNCLGTGAPVAPPGGSQVSLPVTRAVAPNGACTLTVVVTAPARGLYQNTIPAGSATTGVAANAVAASAQLLADTPSVTKAFIPPEVRTGGTSTLLLTLHNPLGTAATLTSLLRDVYPAGIVNHTTPSPTTSCSGGVTATAGRGTMTLPIGVQIPARGSCQVSVVVAGSPATLTGIFVNTIPAGSLSTSLGANAMPAQATLTLSSQADLSVTKVTSPASIGPAGVAAYTVTVANLGPDAVTGATLADAFAGLSLSGPVNVSWVGTGGGATNSATSVITSAGGFTAALSLLPRPAGDRYLRFVFNAVPTVFNGLVTNTVSVQPPPGTVDPVPVNNAAAVTTQLLPVANLQVTKSNGSSTQLSGATTVYNIVFSNLGPSAADGTVIRDAPGAGLSCSSPVCTASGGAACGTLSMGALLSGHPLPSFPAASSVTVALNCQVTASGL